MSGSTRSRQKRKLEPISIEELAGTTGMSGFCTFLTRDNSVGVPALDQLEPAPAVPDESAPDISAPEKAPTSDAQTNAPKLAALEITAGELSAPLSGALEAEPLAIASPISPQISALESIAPAADTPQSTAPDFRRKPRIRQAGTVHEGHSLAEQAVYEAMYRSGKAYQGETRILTIGLRTLAEISRMAYSNCKANVRSLVVKLAIDERPGFSYTDGRTYLIYGLQEILRRRKVAGLTHVVRTRGVAFVDPHTGIPLPIHYPDQFSASVSTAAFSINATRSTSSGADLVESSAPEQIAGILRQYVPDADEAAGTDLWYRCRQNAPDARVEEVAHFIELKAGRPGFRMPLGFLLSAVPKCFHGDTFRDFRLQHSATLRERQFAAKLLQSPEADEEQRQWARDLLASMGQGSR